jgi:hypothetical protein
MSEDLSAITNHFFIMAMAVQGTLQSPIGSSKISHNKRMQTDHFTAAPFRGG